MKVKKVTVGIKSVKETLNDAKDALKKVAKNEKVKKEVGVYFSRFEAFRKTLTPKRLELLNTIKKDSPKSINELARITKRDIKNVPSGCPIIICTQE